MNLLRLILTALFGVMTSALILAVGLYAYIAPELPSTEALRDIQLQVPLRVYSRDERLIAEFGEKRRIPVTIDKVPELMVKAFLAAEDDRFFEHPGVDYQGLLRAGFELARTGEKRQGGSTITMQVARNFFLTTDKTYLRKLTEILLALKIERELTKNQILELYLNKIYLGQRAYGIGAAAQVYYGTTLDALTLAQTAMIAGLPKAPSLYNPITDSKRAVVRRNYILGRMFELGYIDADNYDKAVKEVDGASLHATEVGVEATHLAEMVRAELFRRFGESAYEKALRVYTTLDSRHQAAAIHALRSGLMDYDRRHGYRGPERKLTLPAGADRTAVAALIRGEKTFGGLLPAVVVAVEGKTCRVVLRDGSEQIVHWEGLSWARRYKSVNQRDVAPKSASDVVAVGDLVRIEPQGDNWQLAQLPAIEGALVALDPTDGRVLALVGGFDFYRSKFNRAVQAYRQAGSSFKPFIYSAALEKGLTPASVINDAPIMFDDPSWDKAWRPENYTGRFYGPTRLREALVHSRNVVSIRVLEAIGVRYAIDYVTRFGFRKDSFYPNLSLALGTGTATPLELTRAYAVFANGGYLIEPYFIDRIVDASGNVLFQAQMPRVCTDCGEATTQPLLEAGDGPAIAPAMPLAPALNPQNVWLMTSMLQDVMRRGTAQRSQQMGRNDLAGKTGTTNEQRDAWFCGFNRGLVATAWVGFDEVAPLGNDETGGHTALPVWMRYMTPMLEGVPEVPLDPPPGLVTMRIDPETGLPAGSDQPDAIFETFRQGQSPDSAATGIGMPSPDLQQQESGASYPEQLF
jgi:penicillin-binding protein 1A